jgi:hypothetical protein
VLSYQGSYRDQALLQWGFDPDIILIILVEACNLCSSYYFNADSNWVYYKKFNELKCELFDYGFPDYETNKEQLLRLGITESAFQLLQSYNYADPTVFTIDRLQKIVDMKKPRELSGTTVKQFLRIFPAGFLDINVFYAVLVIVSIWITMGIHNKRSIFLAFYETVVFGLMYFYLFYRGRYLMARVDDGLLLAVLLCFMWLIPTQKKEYSEWCKKSVLLFCITSLIFCQVNWKECWHINMDKMAGITSGQQQKLKEISSDREHLYLCKQGYPDILFAYEPFDSMQKDQFHNLYWLGGWQTFAPVTEIPLKNYGIINPYRDAIGNDKVYFIDNNIDLTIAYIHDYYDPSAYAEPVKTIGEYQIYRILK